VKKISAKKELQKTFLIHQKLQKRNKLLIPLFSLAGKKFIFA
jgi:hypothetical protein